MAATQDDEQYDSANDSDFAPDGEADDVLSSSDEGDKDQDGNGRKRKKHVDAGNGGRDATYDTVYENSGDEAIITKGKKKLKRRNGADDDGGLIKTRSQRAAEKEERRYAANQDEVTIDVDAVWKQMLSGQPAAPTEPKDKADEGEDDTNNAAATATGVVAQGPGPSADVPDMIRIKRTYNFAGRVHVEEKMVARDSAEARLYLASEEGKAATATDGASPPKRATRKAFRSAFEPVMAVAENGGVGRRTDLDLGMTARLQASRDLQAKKLSTVEKSRMDWAGYVDKEGIKDELELAGRSKHSYAARQDFLARSQAIRDEDSRRARMAGRT